MADPAVGQALAETIAAVPHVDAEVFSQTFSASVHDLLMVVYLTNITRAQLAVAEKLNATV